MAGTFRFGDLLLIDPVGLPQLRRGDVAVFYKPESDGSARIVVAHRVVARDVDSLITQGDACASPDVAVVHSSRLLGRVARVQRGNKSYGVWGGLAGRLWARWVRLRRCLLALGRAPYRWLRASGVVRRLWRPSVAHVTLATGQGPIVKYLYHGKTVATWRPEHQSYWCRKPYDLVLDAPLPTTNDLE
ncbi:MAG: S26 family signal peptidase [Anaerolineae bacterium]